MTMEPLSNLAFVTKGFYPDIKKYKDYSPDFFVGKFVKKTFREEDRTEHMWIEVKEVKNNTLVGRLSNDPYFIDGLKCGDEVVVNLEEILAYLNIKEEKYE